MARPFTKARGVFERPKDSGNWWIRFTDQYGQLHREKIGPRSLAVEAYRKRKAEVKEGIYFPNRRKRFALFKEIAQDFLEYSRANKRSAKDDEQRMRYWLNTFSDSPIENIIPQDIERHKEALAQNLAPATVNHYLSILKTTFSLAVRNGKVEKNPVKVVRLLSKNNSRVRYLTEDEEALLMAALPSHMKEVVRFAIYTGLRRGELLALRWEDVDSSTRTLTIKRSKHGESRHIPLNRVAWEVLVSVKQRKVLSPWIFTTTRGQPFYWLDGTFKKALEKAGIENFRFHDLRHTFASRLRMAGVDLHAVKELMGHKTIAMTLRYSHLSPTYLREETERICQGGLVGKTGTATSTSTFDTEKADATGGP